MDGAKVDPWTVNAGPVVPRDTDQVSAADTPTSPEISTTQSALSPERPQARVSSGAIVSGWYTLKVQVLIDLIERLDDQRELSDKDVLSLIGTQAKSGAEEYRRFLKSGGLLAQSDKTWTVTHELQELAVAFRQLDLDSARTILLRVPSVSRFLDGLANTAVGKTWDPTTINRGVQGYTTLGEILLAGAPIPKEGFYPTPSTPSVQEFANVAIEAFKLLDRGDGLISTGAWLETLIRDRGLHPERSRSLLSEASAAGLLQRSTEGSTTDVRHDDHQISVLRLKEGRPVIERVHLYRGDYLISGKSSSSLRIGAL
jgi:hypothetical protein